MIRLRGVQRTEGFPCFQLSAVALPALLLILTGCAERGPVFSSNSSRVWPAPPDPPRIRLVGELTGERNIVGKPTGLEAFGAVLVGAKPTVGFATPLAVGVTGERVFVADPSHPEGPTVHVLDLEARTYSRIREAAGKPLVWPIDVACTPTKLAIADAKRGCVLLGDLGGRAMIEVGNGVLQRPSAVAWRPDGAEFYVLDAAAAAVVVFDAAGQMKSRFGRRGTGPGEFNFPAGLACCLRSPGSAGGEAVAAELVVADSMNFRVQQLEATGGPRRAFGRKGDAAGDFSLPRDVAVDSDGHIYVVDNQFENVQIFDAEGRLLMAFGREGSGPGEFSLPAGITIDAKDRVWVADTYNRRIQVFQYLKEANPQ